MGRTIKKTGKYSQRFQIVIHVRNFCGSMYVQKYQVTQRGFVKYQLYRKMIIPSFRPLEQNLRYYGHNERTTCGEYIYMIIASGMKYTIFFKTFCLMY